MKHLRSNYSENVPLGELFRWKGKDICENRHKGNTESVAAFQSVKDRLTAAQDEILKLIEASDGWTVDEMAVILRKTPNAISGRISELKRMGKIRKDGVRPTRSGCSAAILKAV